MLTNCVDNVVDLENAPHSLGGQGDGAGAHLKILSNQNTVLVNQSELTNRGWTTFSSKMFVMAPFLTLIPAVFSP